jgi:hypothetical protein
VADNPRGEPAGTRNVRLTAGKGKEESSLPKLLEVPAPLPHRKPDELQPSEDLEDSAWNLSFKKGDASRLDLNSEVRPPTSKNVNQPDVFVLKQGAHSSSMSVS